MILRLSGMEKLELLQHSNWNPNLLQSVLNFKQKFSSIFAKKNTNKNDLINICAVFLLVIALCVRSS